MATFVLVPGAWHGSWAFEAVVPLLERAGHTVHALTLTGLRQDDEQRSLFNHLCERVQMIPV